MGKSKSEKKTNTGGWIGKFFGLLVLGVILYWHYYNMVLIPQENAFLSLLSSAAFMGVAILLAGTLQKRVTGLLLEAAVFAVMICWNCYNLTHPVSAWSMCLSWLSGMLWCVYMSVSSAAPGISHSFLRRSYTTVVIWGGMAFYLYVYLQVVPYFWNAFQGGDSVDWFIVILMIIGVLLAGYILFYALISAFAPLYFICYFHKGGAAVQFSEDKYYFVPLNFDRCYELSLTFDEESRRGEEYYMALCMRCADLLYWCPSGQSDDRKYKMPGTQKLDDLFVSVVMLKAITILEKRGAISQARDYTERWLEKYWFKRTWASAYDYRNILKLRARLDDGRPKDPVKEQKLLEELKSIEEREIREKAEYKKESRERRERAEAERYRQMLDEQEDPDEDAGDTDKDGDGVSLSNMPSSLYSGSTLYMMLHDNFGHGAKYVSADNPNDTVLITTIYHRIGNEIVTNAGRFTY